MLNILNIFKTWHAPSLRVQMARVLDRLAAATDDPDLADRRREALRRLTRQTPATRREQTR